MSRPMVVLVELVQLVSKPVPELQVWLVGFGCCLISSWQVPLPIQECVVGWHCPRTVGKEATIEVVEQPLWPCFELLPSG